MGQESQDTLKAKEFFKMQLMKNGVKSLQDEKLLRCQQDAERYAGKVVGNAALLGGLMKGCEAFALVDDRLAGEGTGMMLGINDAGIGWGMLGIFTLIWSLYYVSQKNLGGDDGLGL